LMGVDHTQSFGSGKVVLHREILLRCPLGRCDRNPFVAEGSDVPALPVSPIVMGAR